MKTIFGPAVLTLVCLTAGCAVSGPLPLSAPAGPVASSTPEAADLSAEARVPGIIDFHADHTTDVLGVPDTVQAGAAVRVTITTFGGGCEREGDEGVIVSASTVNVFVYDLTTATRSDAVCPAILKRLPHVVTLRFARPGEALIRVWGRRVGAETPPAGVPTVLEKVVRVE